MVEDRHGLTDFEPVLHEIRQVGEVHGWFVVCPTGSVVVRGVTLLVVHFFVRDLEIGE